MNNKTKMIEILLAALLAIITMGFDASARTVSVRGGVTRSGTYRQPSYRTSPNRTKFDNWSTKGNVSPYTGKKGSKKPYKY